MSINDTVLTTELLEALYKNQLVAPAAAPSGELPSTQIAVWGQNRQRICLLIKAAGEAIVPDEHLPFLTRLLDACHLSPDDIALVNLATQRFDLTALTTQLRPQKLLLFGVSPAAIGIPGKIGLFESRPLAGCSIYAFPALDEINRDGVAAQGLKKQLWSALKVMFGI